MTGVGAGMAGMVGRTVDVGICGAPLAALAPPYAGAKGACFVLPRWIPACAGMMGGWVEWGFRVLLFLRWLVCCPR